MRKYRYFIDNFQKEYDAKKMRRPVQAAIQNEESLEAASPLGKKCFSPKLDLPTINELYIDHQYVSNEYKFEKNMKILKSQPDTSGEGDDDADDIKSLQIQSPLQ